ncbi:RNA polymerase factor sigma-54 [Serratia fonticola]|uniref:RNA polymerase sigma-54 factor n=1 Tax=Serratia fonticola TaxID=47917 RepID=A0A4U9W911_SERFO|nr:RNA polymerase factor sigma-54 [Serratia fonticola]
MIQLSQYAKDTPYLAEARLIVSEHLDLLANHDFRSLMRTTRLKEDTLKEAMVLIHSLDPRPGQSINTGESEYVIPDVLVRKVQDKWVVELNADSIPRLKINQQYAALGNTVRKRCRRPVYPQQFAGSEVADQKPGKPERHAAQGDPPVLSNSRRRSLNRVQNL